MTCFHTFLVSLLYHQSDKKYYFNPISPPNKDIFVYLYTYICAPQTNNCCPLRGGLCIHTPRPSHQGCVYLPYLLPPLQNSLTLPCLSNLIHASRPAPLQPTSQPHPPIKRNYSLSDIPRHILLVPTCTKRLSLNHMQYQLFCK